MFAFHFSEAISTKQLYMTVLFLPFICLLKISNYKIKQHSPNSQYITTSLFSYMRIQDFICNPDCGLSHQKLKVI